jgi:hypothetical protein
LNLDFEFCFMIAVTISMQSLKNETKERTDLQNYGIRFSVYRYIYRINIKDKKLSLLL